MTFPGNFCRSPASGCQVASPATCRRAKKLRGQVRANTPWGFPRVVTGARPSNTAVVFDLTFFNFSIWHYVAFHYFDRPTGGSGGRNGSVQERIAEGHFEPSSPMQKARCSIREKTARNVWQTRKTPRNGSIRSHAWVDKPIHVYLGHGMAADHVTDSQITMIIVTIFATAAPVIATI